jgi:hypothetical protein
MKKALVIVTALLVGWAISSPYVVSQQMKSAAEARDGEALSEHIEFPTLRQNVKDQLNAAMAKEMINEVESNPFAAMGAAFGSMMVEGMVDAFVTPASITEMIKGESAKGARKQSSSEGTEPGKAFKDAELSYKSWDKFSIAVSAEDGEVTSFVLQRRGLGWKLTNIVIPI